MEAVHARGIDPNLAKFTFARRPVAFFEISAKHMLTGYDNLLILFGVVFLPMFVREISGLHHPVMLGNSTTLNSAIVAGIQANYFLVDAVMALSVVIRAAQS